MNKLIIVIIIVALIIFLFFLDVKQRINKVDYQVKDVVFNEINNKIIKGTLKIKIENPIVDVEGKKLKLDIYFNDEKVSVINQSHLIIPKGISFVDIDFSINVKKTFTNKNLRALLFESNNLFKISGFLTLSKYGFSVDIPVNYIQLFKL
ncbi:MAG: hypothetical protein K0B10_07150 [Vicingaceae bacterium]|nr:hypothetical protein [Vicingaceae bacterium]